MEVICRAQPLLLISRLCSRTPRSYSRRVQSAVHRRILYLKPSRKIGRIVRVSEEETTSTEAGRMSQELMESMKSKIQEAVNAESVEVVDVEGDGQHVKIDVVASSFEGKSSVDRQRMVYKAIWYELQNTVHAVDAMTTRTPQESSNT